MAVYLIQGVDGGPVKIGKAENPKARLEDIQRFSPVRLKLLASAAGGRPLEAKLHREHKAVRLWGEWFDLPAEKLAQLKEWMDERPDWRWALLTRGTEMKQLLDDMRAKLGADESLPKRKRVWLSERLWKLRELVTDLRLVMERYLLPTLDEIKRRASLMLAKAGAEGFFPEGEREWFGGILGRLRELAADLRQIIKRQVPAHVLAPPAPPRCAPGPPAELPGERSSGKTLAEMLHQGRGTELRTERAEERAGGSAKSAPREGRGAEARNAGEKGFEGEDSEKAAGRGGARNDKQQQRGGGSGTRGQRRQR